MSERTTYIVSIAVAGVVILGAGLYYLSKTAGRETSLIPPRTSPPASPRAEPVTKSLDEIIKQELSAPAISKPAPLSEDVLKKLTAPAPRALPKEGALQTAPAPTAVPISEDILKNLTAPKN